MPRPPAVTTLEEVFLRVSEQAHVDASAAPSPRQPSAQDADKGGDAAAAAAVPDRSEFVVVNVPQASYLQVPAAGGSEAAGGAQCGRQLVKPGLACAPPLPLPPAPSRATQSGGASWRRSCGSACCACCATSWRRSCRWGGGAVPLGLAPERLPRCPIKLERQPPLGTTSRTPQIVVPVLLVLLALWAGQASAALPQQPPLALSRC